ncbi:DUF3658 domain-containing protein [Paraburkholderia sediminicola]|jgi:Protein of unknown function|uniref:DUF3658 domain-containing protein n=1 Tax=Paraburkholderia sediminicola TaxID=458836 RepID=UPI0038B6B494
MRKKRNEVDMADLQDDAPLTAEQLEAVSVLNEATLSQIDEAILRNVTKDWRKVAMVVGITMQQNALQVKGIPDVFYAQRVILLAEKGAIEAAGNLRRMRRCEIRLPPSDAEADHG